MKAMTLQFDALAMQVIGSEGDGVAGGREMLRNVEVGEKVAQRSEGGDQDPHSSGGAECGARDISLPKLDFNQPGGGEMRANLVVEVFRDVFG